MTNEIPNKHSLTPLEIKLYQVVRNTLHLLTAGRSNREDFMAIVDELRKARTHVENILGEGPTLTD